MFERIEGNKGARAKVASLRSSSPLERKGGAMEQQKMLHVRCITVYRMNVDKWMEIGKRSGGLFSNMRMDHS